MSPFAIIILNRKHHAPRHATGRKILELSFASFCTVHYKETMAITRNSAKRQRQAIVENVFDNDILLNVAAFLESSDLASLALTCRSLGSNQQHVSGWSLVEDVARQIISNSQSEEERSALQRYENESWVALLRELELLRSPLEFDLLVGSRIDYVDGNHSCVTSSNPNPPSSEWGPPLDDDWNGTMQTAICSNQIMRSGKHYATFDLTGCMCLFYFYPGIIRPISRVWGEIGLSQFCPSNSAGPFLIGEEVGDRWGESDVHCCTYYSFEGTCFWSDWQRLDRQNQVNLDWSGREGFDIDDGTVGMLLDLDEGTLSVYKNGRRLGIMKSGLSGEYCWMTTIIAQADGLPHEQNVKIRKGPIPTT
ncbi:hypothetical protein ACHAXR_005086 [Thalassiosira sp. AJA248-18]